MKANAAARVLTSKPRKPSKQFHDARLRLNAAGRILFGGEPNGQRGLFPCGAGASLTLCSQGAGMKRRFYLHLIVIFIVLAALIPVPVSAQSLPAARLMLMRYFTALNFRDFALAYSYWNSPPMSYS